MITLARSMMPAMLLAAFGLGLFAAAALAAGGGNDTPAAAQDPDYAQAVQQVQAGNYVQAAALLERSLATNPNNADAYNYLGYSLRKSGDQAAALVNYQKALALDPKHRGANEYLGELYLEMGELAKARERLKVLDSACFFGCEEYTDLKDAIEAFETAKGS